MKKNIIITAAFLCTTLLIAGGNVAAKMSDVVAIPSQHCKAKMVYKDKAQKLLWQDQAYTDAENGAFKNNRSLGKAGTYIHAIRYCERLQYGGYADWRLPTADELVTVHREEGQSFIYHRDNDFWSSTPATEGRYYVVFPADAQQYARGKRQSNYIRCVRCMHEEAKGHKEETKLPFRTR